MNLLQLIAIPFSLLYGFIMHIRNKLFDLKILQSRQFKIPVISVGNLSFGGTGKTPMVEYIIRCLNKENALATLSRGYKRKTNGFVLADPSSTYFDIGDEPLQYSTKFKNLSVAVDENRVKGIKKLQEKFTDLNAIILDDAFQHRYVKPGLSILTTDFHKLYSEDYILPSGTLRESRCGAKRADIIIVTKSPKVLSPITKRRIQGMIKPKLHQQLLFSYIDYGAITPLCKENEIDLSEKFSSILMFSGIANPYPLIEHLKNRCNELVVLEFRDHHSYSLADLERIKTEFENIFTSKKLIVTTEKDAMRLQKNPEFKNILKNLQICYIPIEMKFHNGDNVIFDKLIMDYVKENKSSN